PPDIWRDRGRSFSSMYSMRIVFSLPNKSALSLIISAHTSPAPNSLTVSLNAALETPAMGASTTRFEISTSPILNILLTGFQVFRLPLRGRPGPGTEPAAGNSRAWIGDKCTPVHLRGRNAQLIDGDFVACVQRCVDVYCPRPPCFLADP